MWNLINIKYLFEYLSNMINENSIVSYFEKGENMFNKMKDYINAYNKQWEKVKNQNLKKMDIYELNKNIKHYGEKTLKIYNYILLQYDSKYKYDKNMNNIFNCIKIRLHLSSFFYSLNKKYEYVFYFYSAFLLLTEYLKNLKKQSPNETSDEEKEIRCIYRKSRPVAGGYGACLRLLFHRPQQCDGKGL